jgi:hypothetical protein
MEQSTSIEIIWEKTEEGNARVLRVYGREPILTMPEQVDGYRITEIGSYCFARENRLKEQPKTKPYMTELCGAFIEEITLPETLKKIGNLAFYNCTSLKHISMGTAMEAVGSDAFMNCKKLHQITVRGKVSRPSGIRPVLAQISADLEVIFEEEGTVDAVVFYPEYYESLDEIAPAHIFGRNIEGEGFRARQCFRDGVADLTQYDMIFPKACAEENGRTLAKLVSARLKYPVGMNETARKWYEAYAAANAGEICQYAMEQKNLGEIRFFCANGYANAGVLSECIRQATEMEWAEGTAALLHIKREFFEETAADRYSFDAF